MRLHQKQKEIVKSKARFKIVRAGRRSGKTVLKIETLLFKAVSNKDSKVYYIAPTQNQARDIIWEALKTRIGTIGNSNEQFLEMKVPTKDGGSSLIKIAGWETRENFRGKSADHLEFDEVDTMKDFFIGWKQIFRPTLIDRKGTANFGGTPKKENPNLKRLERENEKHPEWQSFHFTTYDNEFLPREELDALLEEYKDDKESYRQEILAENVENEGALFKFTALLDLFSNTIEKTNSKYLTVDVAGEGNDRTIFTYWEGLSIEWIEIFRGLSHEEIIQKTREYASKEKIPFSQIAIDGIGEGSGVVSSSLLEGVVSFKSSYSAIKTDEDPVRLPNVHYTKNAVLTTEYKNLRSQCVFTLANLVNNHAIAVKVDGEPKEQIIEELQLYQDVSKGDGKRMATQKDDIKLLLGRSPDITDTLIMRMYFVIKEKMTGTSEEEQVIKNDLDYQFDKAFNRQHLNSTK